MHNPGIYAGTFANTNIQSFYFGENAAREQCSLGRIEDSTSRETRVSLDINNIPIINFDKLTIDYDEDYVDEELKLLYVVSNSESESESDYDSDYY